MSTQQLRRIRLFLFATFLSCITGIITAQQWDGPYQGQIQGVPCTLTLKTIGQSLDGVIDAQGYRYTLDGHVQGSSASGKLTDPQTQGTMDFVANLNGSSLTLNLTATDPNTGQQQGFSMSFTAGEAQSGQGVQGMVEQSQPTDANVQRDQRLIGLWSYSESYTSGEYSFASQWKMQINPDGTYLYGDGRVIGGGGGVSGDSGGGDVTRGQWKTQGNIIYINEGSQWQPYCQYYLEGYSLLMKFADGSKQVWKRTQ